MLPSKISHLSLGSFVGGRVGIGGGVGGSDGKGMVNPVSVIGPEKSNRYLYFYSLLNCSAWEIDSG